MRARNPILFRLGVFAAATLVGAAQLGASCVDGVTADCSDPAVCAPSIDSGHTGEASVIPEASTDTGVDASSASDAAGSDADADAPADGG